MHMFQKHILDELRRSDARRYSELQPDGVESSHFRYHLGQLTKTGFVEQTNTGTYRLTEHGKAAVDHLSDERVNPRMSPKVITYTLLSDEDHHYLYRKTKDPYRGLLNMVGGKVHVGELCHEASRREVQEKTGLVIADSTLQVVAEVKISSSTGLLSHAITYVFTAQITPDLGTSSLKKIPKTKLSGNLDIAPDLLPLLSQIDGKDVRVIELDLLYED